MAGSLKWLKYTDDSGVDFAYFGDESNVENVVVDDTSFDIVSTDTIKYSVPQNIQKRFATFKSTTTPRVKKVVIPTIALYNALAENNGVLVSREWNDTELSEQFVLQSLTPERIRPIVGANDTQLNDGDAS